MKNNINIARFDADSNKAKARDIWQWDYGQILRIQGLSLPSAVEIHFSLQEKGGEATRRIGTTKDGVTDVVIPDSMIENESAYGDSYKFYAYIYLTDEESGQTEYEIECVVKTRSKPEGYVSGDSTFADILKTVNEIADEKVTRPDTAKIGQVLSVSAVDEEGKPTEFSATDMGGGVSEEQIAEAVGTYMAENPIEESDPTVPQWAKQPTKPKYTASEVGALPDTTKIPSKTSDLQNDSGFTTLTLDESLTDNTKAAPAGLVGELKGDLDNIKYPTKLSELSNDLFYYNKTEALSLSIDDFTFNDDGSGMGDYSYTSSEPIYDIIDIESIDYHIVGLYGGESIDCEKSENAKISNDYFIDNDIIIMYIRPDGMLQINVNNIMFIRFEELSLVLYKIDFKKIPIEVINTDSITQVYVKDESGKYNIQKTLHLLNYTNIETRSDMYELSENLSFNKDSNHICFGYTPTYVIRFQSPFTTNKHDTSSCNVGDIIENVEVLTGEEEKKFTKVFNSNIDAFVLHYDIRLVNSNSIVTLTQTSISMLSGIHVDKNLNVYAVVLLYNTDTKTLKEMIKRIA